MTKLRRHLLERSPEETARRLCLRLLDEAAKALDRMDRPEDTEALHDFRVALRRLRSLMRAYRSYLRGSALKKHRARIKALAASTNSARDAEVQIAWLTAEREKLGEPAASGADTLMSVLGSRQATTPSRDGLRKEFEPLRHDLTKALSRLRLRDEGDTSSFVQATAGLVQEHASALRSSLDEAHSAEDDALLHRARIEAKRLRYILEPLQLEIEEARPLIKRMKSLQDCLGELQDTRVLTEEISNALETSALETARRLRELALAEAELPAQYPPQNPGLLALLKSQRARRDRAFQVVAMRWTGSAAGAFFALIDRLVERLQSWPGTELPRRRFLLAQVPHELRRQKMQSIRAGWLPGKSISEQVRATREGRTTRYVRIVSGNGTTPLEEPLTRRTFDEFWSLTEGRRLEARRFHLTDGSRTWNILSIPDQDIVLAVVEGTGDIPIPDPIQRELVRDVTGMKKYEPESLAKAHRLES